MSNVYMYGIDVSEWDGNVDFSLYKDQFVIIRLGFGTNIDKKAVRNMNECEKFGIPYGVYWHSYALTAKDAEEEAELCLNMINGKRKVRVGVWIKMSDADHYKEKHGVTSQEDISAICKAFCEKIKKAGYYIGIQSDASWFGIKIKECGKYDWWVSSYGVDNGKLNTNTSAMGSLQQYSSKPLFKNVMYKPIYKYADNRITMQKSEDYSMISLSDDQHSKQNRKSILKLFKRFFHGR